MTFQTRDEKGCTGVEKTENHWITYHLKKVKGQVSHAHATDGHREIAGIPGVDRVVLKGRMTPSNVW